MSEKKQGCLNAPDRHPIDWRSPDYLNEMALLTEMERIYDICQGCRRCVNLCHAFPTLFDLIDATAAGDISEVSPADYFKPVEHCYLCDRCYMVKCPYVPPHEWAVDFPHLMLRAKAFQFKNHGAKVSDKVLTATDTIGKLSTIPVVVEVVNAANKNKLARKALAKTLNVHPKVTLPTYYHPTAQQALKNLASINSSQKVVIFVTCYGNYNAPKIVEDLVAVLHHNQCEVKIVAKEKCCGMPKLEVGDFAAIEKSKDYNVKQLLPYVQQGYTILAPIPSCVLMFKQELPLLFIDDDKVMQIRDAIQDPFEYLLNLHKQQKLRIDFKTTLGNVFYHQPCHSQVQNIGSKARDVLALIADTQVTLSQRCSGHNGTYGVKVPYFELSLKIGRPIAKEIAQLHPDVYTSDCPMAGQHIADNLHDKTTPLHPISLLRKAYGV